jgi:hypothetical protein
MTIEMNTRATEIRHWNDKFRLYMATIDATGKLVSPARLIIDTSAPVFNIDCKNDNSPFILLSVGSGAGITTNLSFSNLPDASRGIIKSTNISGALKFVNLPNASGTIIPVIKSAHNAITVVEFIYIDGLYSFQLWS